jgi:hypothetical protein
MEAAAREPAGCRRYEGEELRGILRAHCALRMTSGRKSRARTMTSGKGAPVGWACHTQEILSEHCYLGPSALRRLQLGDSPYVLGRRIGGRDRDRTGDPLLAKQVLSQLSYTPTVKTYLDFKVFARVRKLRNATSYPILFQDCVKPLPPEPCRVKTPGILLARRSILSRASLLICDFVCECFLNTCGSLWRPHVARTVRIMKSRPGGAKRGGSGNSFLDSRWSSTSENSPTLTWHGGTPSAMVPGCGFLAKEHLGWPRGRVRRWKRTRKQKIV